MKPTRSVSGATGTGKSNTLLKVLMHRLQRSESLPHLPP